MCRYRHFADATQLNSTLLDVELSCVAINGTEAIIGHIEQYEVGTLDVDGWAVTIGTARRGLGGASKFFFTTLQHILRYSTRYVSGRFR